MKCFCVRACYLGEKLYQPGDVDDFEECPAHFDLLGSAAEAQPGDVDEQPKPKAGKGK